MKFTHNNIFIFFNDRETTSQVVEIVGKSYPEEKNHLIDSASQLSDALDILDKRYRERVFYDVIILDLSIKQTDRRRFVDEVTGKQVGPEFVAVINNTEIKKRDKKFIENKNVSLVSDINEFALISLLENIFEKKFHEKKFNFINRIDDIVSLKINYQQILDRIVEVTLDYLGLKICWVSLVDYEANKLKIGALTGFGKHETAYEKAFSISLSEKSVTTECINKREQIQYKDVLSDECPYKYKDLAKKIGLKSVLLTPIFKKGEKGSDKKIIATLNLYTDFHHEFQEDECELAGIIASKTSVVLSMKDVYEEEKDEGLKRLELVERVAAEINKNVSDHQKVFKTIVEEGVNLVQADRGCIKLCHDDHISCEWHMKCDSTFCTREDYREFDITTYVVKKKKSLLIDDLDSFPHKDPDVDYDGVSSRISVPLLAGEKVVGVLTAEHTEKNYFTTHHLQLFEALARHAVIAIENTNRYKQLQKRLQSQMIIKLLIEETSKLEAIEDGEKRNKYRIEQLEKIIEKVLKETGKVFEAKSGYVVLAGFKSSYAIRNPRWRFGLSRSDLPKLEIGVKENGKVTFKERKSITGKVIAEGELYNCKNVAEDDFYLNYGENDESKSEVVVPLKFQRQTYGALALDSIYENGFSREDEEILESIATQMALLIKRFGYLNTLLDLNKPFQNIDNHKGLYNEITDRTVGALGTEVSYLRVLDRNGLVVKGCTGISSDDSPALIIGEGISGKVAQTLKPAIVRNVQDPSGDYKHPEFAKRNNLFAKISVPIFSITPDSKKGLIGVLNTYSKRICNFTELDLQLMLAIADKAGEAIKKAKLFKQLDEIAKIDEKLTTTTEKDVLQDIANIAKDLLDADQVVLYQYNSSIKDNFGFSTLSTASGTFLFEEFKSPTNFHNDSLLVLLLGQKSNEFFVESYEKDLMNLIYNNRVKNNDVEPFYQREQLKSVIILKLTYKEEVVGILFINYRYQKSFSLEEKRIAKTFANKAAIAISNIRKYEDIDRLHNVGNIIARESDIDNVLESIAKYAQITLNADIVIVHRYDKIGKKAFHPPICWGTIYEPGAILGESGEDNVKFRLIEKGEDVFAVDVSKDNIFKSSESWNLGKSRTPRFAKRERIKSCAAMLLKVRKEIVGVMFINYRKKQSFDPQQRRKIEIFANQAAIAIRNANLIDESKRTVNRMSMNINAIQESGYAIVESLNKKEVSERDILKPILDKALELISVDMGYIGLSNKEARNTKVVVCSKKYSNLLNKSLTRFYPEAPWIKKHEKFDIFPDEERKDDLEKKDDEREKSDYQRFADNPQFLSGHPEVTFTADKNVQSALRVPIYSAKEFLGMIVLESETPNAFSKIDAYAVMSLANQASLAFQNYRLIKQLRKLREIDIAILKKQNDLDYILDFIMNAALELVNKKHGEIYLLIDEDTLKIEKSIPGSVGLDLLKVTESICGLAILTKKTHYEPNIAISKNRKLVKTKKSETKSELVVPLIADENLIGVLNIKSDKVKDFTKEDIYVLELLSNQAAIAIFLSQQRERLLETQKEASIGYVTRESVHWVGNKIGPISRRVENINDGLVELHSKGIINEDTLYSFLKDLSIIKKGTDSALSIKSDLIDSNKQKDKFDLIKLLRDVIENFENEYSLIEGKGFSEEHSFQYSINLDLSLDSFLFYWDIDHIGRVFHYILKNAFQAIEDKILTKRDLGKDNFAGEITVRVSKLKEHLGMEIKDNGIGVKVENRSLIFRPFHSTKGADRGSGVGLYFCKRTMEEFGGKVYLKETEVGKGTIFALEFPYN